MLYIVLFLHQTTTLQVLMGHSDMLYIVLFLHQTTTGKYPACSLESCISYYSYIKPQPNTRETFLLLVVYRTIPTSNHNSLIKLVTTKSLYIVLFLHQTTTSLYIAILERGCISYYSYIKPQLQI